ncbi:MAG: kelch repeat-containing protein, partial [Candidatus Thorarchaeota archaeon]
LLFGGFNESGWETDDTWRFDCDTREWTELHPTTTPLARYGHVMVYDESINLIVLTAGNTASQGHQHDTWTYNASANVWTELTPIGTPDRLKWPSMTYDSVNQKCILFGGQIGDNPVDHTWVYDAQQNTWTRQYPSNAPSARINAGLAFDSENNITILFGGTALGAHQFDDTWTYSYESNAWTNVTYGAGPSSSTTPTPTPSGGPGFDPVLLALALPIGASIIVIVAVILRKKP